MADGDYLSNRADIEQIFGAQNVLRWANPDNVTVEEDPDIDTKIEERIDWANKNAQEEFYGRLLDGPYNVDDIFNKATPENAPTICVTLAATRAGLYLYDTRRIVDETIQTDEVNHHRQNWDKWIKQIMGGQMKLRNPATGEPLERVSGNAPAVVPE